VPFVWFGCPITALGLCPWIVACISVLQDCADAGCAAGTIAASPELLVWFSMTLAFLGFCLRKWYRLLASPEGINAMYGSKSLLPIILGGAITAWLLDNGAVPRLRALVSGERDLALAASSARSLIQPLAFYLCSYMFTQVFVMVGKVFGRRMRPGVALSRELQKVPRAIPALNYLDIKGSTVFESFPSGDAAGAAVFSSALVATASWSPYYACVFAGLSAFGRVYLFAHHVFDVSVGMAIAVACSKLLNGELTGEGPGWWSDHHIGHIFFAVSSALLIAPPVASPSVYAQPPRIPQVPAFMVAYFGITNHRKPVPKEHQEGSAIAGEESKAKVSKQKW